MERITFKEVLKRKLEDPAFRATYKKTRRKLRKEMTRRSRSKRRAIPAQVRHAYGKVLAHFRGDARSLESWWYSTSENLGLRSPKEVWEAGNQAFVLALLDLKTLPLS